MSNLTNNRLNVTMTAAQVAAVKTALQTIATNMPFLIGLTKEERIALPKINVNNKAFTEDAINAVANNAGILPAYISASGMQNDYQLFVQLDELLGLMRQLVEKTEDTQMLAGSEAFVGSLSSYKLFGAAADAGVVGADAIVDLLRQRFLSSGLPGEQSAT
ncbi:MAG: hypothetical protein M0D53_01380 [Flavobacterium sp. JAD_PAG50586_2]|nr:MAG: hypothetical protein M0D53_01380 [Flavobacterium sp. JAD_PAG50586_2]